MPFSRNYDPNGVVLRAAVQAGVSVVVMLASDEECAKRSSKTSLRGEYERLGWVVVSCFVLDFGIPTDVRVFAAHLHQYARSTLATPLTDRFVRYSSGR